jgi:hypothetical protein
MRQEDNNAEHSVIGLAAFGAFAGQLSFRVYGRFRPFVSAVSEWVTGYSAILWFIRRL